MNKLLVGTAMAALVFTASASASDLARDSQATAYYRIPLGKTAGRDAAHRLGFRLDHFTRSRTTGQTDGVRWARPAAMDVSFTRSGFDAVRVHGRNLTPAGAASRADDGEPVLGVPGFAWGVMAAGALAVVIAKATEEDNDAPR